jgi:uncharacterized membrane protein
MFCIPTRPTCVEMQNTACPDGGLACTSADYRRTVSEPLPRYSAFAGRSLSRLAGLSDGVFAVAMTLLVLDLKVPSAQDVHTDARLGQLLVALGPRVLTYLLSFLTLGIFWIGQQTQLDMHVERADRTLSWLHIAFLCAVTTMPFSTALLAEFIHLRLPVGVYWLNLLVLGLLLYLALGHAERAGLLADDADPRVLAAQRRRILGYQSAYAAAAALCLIDPYVSIVALVLLQLHSVLAPPRPRRARRRAA